MTEIARNNMGGHWLVMKCALITQVQHGMGPLINVQKSVFLLLWDNYELYGRKILHLESFSAIESENLVRISKFFA